MWLENIFPSTGKNGCGASAGEDYHVKSFTMLEHFAPNAWLTWTTSLNQAANEAWWGLLAVKVSTFMDNDAYTPFYQSSFQFEQVGDWALTDASGSVHFTTCSGVTLFGGWNKFRTGTIASKSLSNLPLHSSGTKLGEGVRSRNVGLPCS
jgi:hypothetical protein